MLRNAVPRDRAGPCGQPGCAASLRPWQTRLQVISLDLARKLHDAGLEWLPKEGDRFVIPDRELEERVFSISEMTVDVHDVPTGRLISFNGAVEWALDSIMESDVIWLPSEAQLRDRLGLAFRALEAADGGFTCRAEIGEELRSFEAAEPADAYAMALLDLLQQPESHLRLMLGDV